MDGHGIPREVTGRAIPRGVALDDFRIEILKLVGEFVLLVDDLFN